MVTIILSLRIMNPKLTIFMNTPKKFICVIPARYASSRFEGKPLVEINGQSMISRVWQNASSAEMVEKAIVATDDKRIYEHCKEAGCDVVYTSPDCNDGSARVAEVAEGIEADYFFEMQGDQPLVTSKIIDSFLTEARVALEDNGNIDIVQPYAVASKKETASPDVVKVPISNSGRMIVVTRQPIDCGFRTLGLYLWRRETLLKFPSLPITDYERSETCHLVRFYLNDLYVQGVKLDGSNWIEVDRLEHIKEVESVLLNE